MFIRFRLGVSELKSHKFRYTPEVHSLACPLCNHSPEDEVHFLFYCPGYEDMRRSYLHKFILDYFKHQKLAILKTQNHESIADLAKFIFYAFKHRKSLSEDEQDGL
jgi:hypothetical protein